MSSPSPRVASLDITPLGLELARPLRWDTGSLTVARHALVRVTLTDGTVGMAEAVPRPTIHGETPATVTHAVRDWIAPRLVGRSIDDVFPETGLTGHLTAHASVDMALHHARARRAGVTLAAHLASERGVRGATAPRVATILGLDTIDAVLDDARAAHRRGIRVFKVKMSKGWRQTCALLDALRADLGETCTIYVDANQALPVEDGPDCLAALAARGVAYIEEPFDVTAYAARRRLHARSPLPWVADESVLTLRALRTQLELGMVDIVNIKPARTGFTQSIAMAALARRHGARVMIGSQASGALGAAWATALACAVEADVPCELDFWRRYGGDPVRWPAALEAGRLVAEADPTLDETALADPSNATR